MEALIQYFVHRVLKRAFSNGKSRGWDQMIAVAIFIALTLLDLVFSGIKVDLSSFHWKPIAMTYGAFFLLFLVWHYLRAQWEVQKEDAATIEALKNRAVSNPPFHPHLDEMGRRIESAIYGSANKVPDNVTKKLLGFVSARKQAIPVNHYELCDGHDPDEGEDLKFLTVTMSETLRQSSKLELPLDWLNGSGKEALVKNAPLLQVKQEYRRGYDWLEFSADKDVRYPIIEPLISVKRSALQFISGPGPIKRGSFERVRVMATDPVSGNVCPLFNLVDPENRTEDSVTLFYQDEAGTQFSRTFILTRRDDSVEWKPAGDPKLSG